MKFSIKAGDLRKALSGSEAQIAKAVTAGMRDATDGLKGDLRGDVRDAGLGGRLANTWRGETYPKGQESVGAAAYAFSKAPKLIDAYSRGVTILPGRGRYLAIPTDLAGRKIGRERVTPERYEQRTGQKLRFVKGRGSSAFLVADPRKSRVRNRKARSGRSVVVFILVPQARVRKRLDIESIANRWAEKVPSLVSSHWS